MKTRQDQIDLASKLLNARPLRDGRYAYRADETGTDWVVDEDDLIRVLSHIDHGDTVLSSRAYNDWCEDTTAEELVGANDDERNEDALTGEAN